jgi:hypothetical protein
MAREKNHTTIATAMPIIMVNFLRTDISFEVMSKSIQSIDFDKMNENELAVIRAEAL